MGAKFSRVPVLPFCRSCFSASFSVSYSASFRFSFSASFSVSYSASFRSSFIVSFSVSVNHNVRVSVSDQTFRTERMTSELEIDIKELQNAQEADYVPTLCNTDSKVKPWLPR